MTCVCGLPIVRGRVLAWTHEVNPGPRHHYARPALRPALDDSTAALGTRARGDGSSAARSAGTAPQPGDIPPPPG